jgi:hypothetical protein
VTATTEATPWAPIDIAHNQVIASFGRKGEGKSALANMLYRNWPGIDRLVIDVSGDDRPWERSKHITEAPTKMPAREDPDVPVDLWYVANPASPTYRDDLDRALRCVLYPRDRKTLVCIHEVGEVMPAGQTPGNGRLLLQQGRHFNVSTILCGPRPIDIEPLALQQADEVFLYDLPNPNDRRRIAETIGFPPKVIDEAVEQLRAKGSHWFLRYRRRGHELVLCPPLPAEWLDPGDDDAH